MLPRGGVTRKLVPTMAKAGNEAVCCCCAGLSGRSYECLPVPVDRRKEANLWLVRETKRRESKLCRACAGNCDDAIITDKADTVACPQDFPAWPYFLFCHLVAHCNSVAVL